MRHTEIVEFTTEYAEGAKDLLVELQEHISALDKRGVIVLKNNYREDYYAYVLKQVAEHDGRIFLSVENGKVTGIIVCKIFQGGDEEDITTSCPKIGFISDLCVTKDLCGQGIGSSLLKTAERYFAEKGCDYAQLEVFAPNTSAFKLYQELGFAVNCYYLSKRIDK